MGTVQDNWLTLKQAKALLENLKVGPVKNLTATCVFHGYVRKAPDKIHWEYSEQSLRNYAKKLKESVPKEWITVLEASELFEIPLSRIYYKIKTKQIRSKIFTTKGLKYVSKTELKSCL